MVITNDGPSLGGFVCPATITSAQLWKAGQVSPLDTVRFQLQTLGTHTRTKEHSCSMLHLECLAQASSSTQPWQAGRRMHADGSIRHGRTAAPRQQS